MRAPTRLARAAAAGAGMAGRAQSGVTPGAPPTSSPPAGSAGFGPDGLWLGRAAALRRAGTASRDVREEPGLLLRSLGAPPGVGRPGRGGEGGAG